MPRVRTSEKLIHKIYRRKFEDLSMYFFVVGQKSIMPGISVEKALYNYFKYIGDEDFNLESSMTTYFRLQTEYYESTKENN